MEHIIIPIVALLASLLTFFSGFGLGTLLTPFLVLFFPAEIAIALTGIVHLLNNLFKIGLVGKKINWEIGLKFGIPAIIGAFIGALILHQLSDSTSIYSYQFYSKTNDVTFIKITIAVLMIGFSLFELVPRLKNLEFEKDKMYIGGIISGFFGGLSGNQGALRSAFLIRFGLSKEVYIATGVLIACCIDITRLSVYFENLSYHSLKENSTLLIITTLAAFMGAFIGNKLLKKVTLIFIQRTVAILILLIAVGLGSGIL